MPPRGYRSFKWLTVIVAIVSLELGAGIWVTWAICAITAIILQRLTSPLPNVTDLLINGVFFGTFFGAQGWVLWWLLHKVFG